MKQSPLEWRRGPRSTFNLSLEPGVYALFLREGSTLPGVKPGDQGLLYIGLAANRNGLKGRCHFDARTRNHSPRKSLAALPMKSLELSPTLITKPNSSDTWGLDAPSELRLSEWMHDNLDLAIEICAAPDSRETELVGRYAPPLNLTKCTQSASHRRISEGRAAVFAELQGKPSSTREVGVRHETPLSHSAHRYVELDVDTAEAIAARFGLNPKSYRQRLRDSVAWYSKPQDWTFPVNSTEWHDMIAVAKKMVR
jgi:hypothetical protein